MKRNAESEFIIEKTPENFRFRIFKATHIDRWEKKLHLKKRRNCNKGRKKT